MQTCDNTTTLALDAKLHPVAATAARPQLTVLAVNAHDAHAATRLAQAMRCDFRTHARHVSAAATQCRRSGTHALIVMPILHEQRIVHACEQPLEWIDRHALPRELPDRIVYALADGRMLVAWDAYAPDDYGALVAYGRDACAQWPGHWQPRWPRATECENAKRMSFNVLLNDAEQHDADTVRQYVAARIGALDVPRSEVLRFALRVAAHAVQQQVAA